MQEFKMLVFFFFNSEFIFLKGHFCNELFLFPPFLVFYVGPFVLLFIKSMKCTLQSVQVRPLQHALANSQLPAGSGPAGDKDGRALPCCRVALDFLMVSTFMVSP